MREQAQQLKAEGLTVVQIAERLGVARSTVGDWVKPRTACPECGGEMGAHGYRYDRCGDCRVAPYHDRLEKWVAMRRAGIGNRQIAAQEGVPAHVVTGFMSRARKADPSIPRDPYMDRRQEMLRAA